MPDEPLASTPRPFSDLSDPIFADPERRARVERIKEEVMAEQQSRHYLSTHPAPPPGPPSVPMHVTFTRRDDGYVEVEWRTGVTYRQRAYLSPDDCDDLSTFLDKGVWLASLPDPPTSHGDLIDVVDLDADR